MGQNDGDSRSLPGCSVSAANCASTMDRLFLRVGCAGHPNDAVLVGVGLDMAEAATIVPSRWIAKNTEGVKSVHSELKVQRNR